MLAVLFTGFPAAWRFAPDQEAGLSDQQAGLKLSGIAKPQ